MSKVEGSRASLRLLAFAIPLAVAGCGHRNSSDPDPPPRDAGAPTATGDAVAALDLRPLPLGKPDLTGFSYSRGLGQKSFRMALTAQKAGDWPGVERACRETLLVDPGHLEAYWLLSLALSQQRRFAEAAAPLSAAIAGDWMRWGRRVRDAEAFAEFFASPVGEAFTAVADRYEQRFRERLRAGLLVVGRRGTWRRPTDTGATRVNHRSELYAYDLDTGRFLRVSRTNGSLVATLRSPSSSTIAFVSYRKLWLPTEAERRGGASPRLREVRVGTIDLDGARMSLREVAFEDVGTLELLFASSVAGAEQLPRRVRPAPGAPALVAIVDGVAHVLDPEDGTAHPVEAIPRAARRLRVAYDVVELRQSAVDDVAADCDDDGVAGAFLLEPTQRTVTLPDGALADRDSLRWSPQRARLAFATRAIDPCSDDAADRVSTLYVVEAATGKLRAVASGEGRFASEWVDDQRLAYVDHAGDDAGVRVLDVLSGGEIARLDVRGGVGTFALPDELCVARLVADKDEPDDEIN